MLIGCRMDGRLQHERDILMVMFRHRPSRLITRTGSVRPPAADDGGDEGLF